MFLRMIIIELRKLGKHPFLWLELAGMGCLFAGYFALRAYSVRTGMSDPRNLEVDLQAGLGLFAILSVLFMAATAAFISSFDFMDRGVQLWLVRGVPRPLLMLARLCVLLVTGLGLSAAALLLVLVSSVLARMIFGGSMSLDNLNGWQVLPSILRLFWASVPYLSLTFLLAIVSRSPVFATGGTVLFRFVVEYLLSGFSEQYPELVRFLPAQLSLSLQMNFSTLDRSAPPVTLGGMFLPEAQAALVIAAMLVLAGGLSVWIFSRQDWGG